MPPKRTPEQFPPAPFSWQHPRVTTATNNCLLLTPHWLLLLLSHLLKIKLDHPSVAIAVLGFHVLNNLGTQLTGQLTPAFAGIFLHVGGQQGLVNLAGCVGSRFRRVSSAFRLALLLLLLLLFCQLLGCVLEVLGRLLH